jgi:hypothetical protein
VVAVNTRRDERAHRNSIISETQRAPPMPRQSSHVELEQLQVVAPRGRRRRRMSVASARRSTSHRFAIERLERSTIRP